MISLENFNPNSLKEPILNSPRSLEACRRQGILPKELIKRTLEEIRTLYGDNKLDKAGLEIIAEHYEERREEKVKVLLDERNQIIQEEKVGFISFSPKHGPEARSKSVTSSVTHSTNRNYFINDSTVIEKEKMQLEKIKQRQEKEIKQMLDYEIKVAEMKIQQEKKIEYQQERDRKFQLELAQKKKEAEERKRQEELEKRMKSVEEEERRKALAVEEYRKEQERALIEKHLEKERRQEAKRREEEKRRRHQEFIKTTEDKLMEQQMLVEKRKKSMGEREKFRQEHLRQQQLLQKQDAEEKRKQLEEKLKSAKEKNDEILLFKKIELEERQRQYESKKQQFEEEMEAKKIEHKMRAEKKSELIQKVKEESSKIHEKKKEDFYHQKMMAEARKRELDMKAEHERKIRLNQEKEKEMRRQQVKANMENRLQERVEGYLSKMSENDEKLLKVQMDKEEALKNRHALEIIRRVDKLENVERIKRMQEYQKEKLLDRINYDTIKATQIKQERGNLRDLRMSVKRDMERSKKTLMDKFEKVKRGRMSPEHLTYESTQSISMIHQNDSKYKHQESYESSYSPPINKSPIDLEKNFPSKRNLSNEIKRPTPKSFRNVSSLNNTSRKEAIKLIESLKTKQNYEMLALLEEEQDREIVREKKLLSISDPKEKEKFEETFAIERAEAHAKIQTLADSHDEAIQKLVAKFNLTNIVKIQSQK